MLCPQMEQNNQMGMSNETNTEEQKKKIDK